MYTEIMIDYKKTFKISISDITYNILCNDGENWDITNTDGKINMSGFVNKLLPIMLKRRTSRREQMADEVNKILGDIDEKMKDRLLSAANAVVDRIYFSHFSSFLEREIYVRPNEHSANAFAEICEQEAKIAQTTPTEYIRDLLNEYTNMPEHIRKEIFYSDEIDVIYECIKNRTMTFLCDGQSYLVVPITYLFGYAEEQEVYIISYDVGGDVLRSTPLHKIKKPIAGRKYKLDDKILKAYDKYVEKNEFLRADTYTIE